MAVIRQNKYTVKKRQSFRLCLFFSIFRYDIFYKTAFNESVTKSSFLSLAEYLLKNIPKVP